jgi:hypothetical protein
MVVLGWPLRTAALLLGLWCLLTGYLEHRGNLTEFLKNVTMAGGFFRAGRCGRRRAGVVWRRGARHPGLAALTGGRGWIGAGGGRLGSEPAKRGRKCVSALCLCRLC